MSSHRLAFPFAFLARPCSIASRAPLPPSASKHIQPPIQKPRLSAPSRVSRFTSASRASAAAPASQRYGTANEPPPHLKKSPSAAPPSNGAAPAERQPRIGAPKTPSQPQESKPADAATEPAADHAKSNQTAAEASAVGSGAPQNAGASAAQQSQTQPQPLAADFPREPGGQSALQTIMSTEAPEDEQNGVEKPPHLEPPRYVHHFDTFTLVRSLQDGGFSEDEAVTVMKSVRAILADNMNLARDGLMSKSDAEMAAYLFRAACSELRAEMQNRRSALTERMRTERTSLQHEVDIVSQQITAETGQLKDELKGMFDDRKMAVRMERRDIENKTQELNYSITAQLQSEMRSEVEGLRWVLVRRTAMALAAVAFAALLTLRIQKVGERRKEGAVAEGGGQPAESGTSSGVGGSSA